MESGEGAPRPLAAGLPYDAGTQGLPGRPYSQWIFLKGRQPLLDVLAQILERDGRHRYFHSRKDRRGIGHAAPLLLQQVTVAGDENGSPILLGHVDIGAGARILGNVTIGAHAKIGANAVVLTDVPEGATAVGIPARILLPKMEK